MLKIFDTLESIIFQCVTKTAIFCIFGVLLYIFNYLFECFRISQNAKKFALLSQLFKTFKALEFHGLIFS